MENSLPQHEVPPIPKPGTIPYPPTEAPAILKYLKAQVRITLYFFKDSSTYYYDLVKSSYRPSMEETNKNAYIDITVAMHEPRQVNCI